MWECRFRCVEGKSEKAVQPSVAKWVGERIRLLIESTILSVSAFVPYD